jgi:hypothetical protein
MNDEFVVIKQIRGRRWDSACTDLRQHKPVAKVGLKLLQSQFGQFRLASRTAA